MNESLKQKINDKKKYFHLMHIKGLVYKELKIERMFFTKQYSFPCLKCNSLINHGHELTLWFSSIGDAINVEFFDDATVDNNNSFRQFRKDDTKGILKFLESHKDDFLWGGV